MRRVPRGGGAGIQRGYGNRLDSPQIMIVGASPLLSEALGILLTAPPPLRVRGLPERGGDQPRRRRGIGGRPHLRSRLLAAATDQVSVGPPSACRLARELDDAKLLAAAAADEVSGVFTKDTGAAEFTASRWS